MEAQTFYKHTIRNKLMNTERSLKDYALITAKGLGMGAADVVPGVSGGTIAFITGIYEELLTSISNINLKALKVLRQDGIKSFWRHINANFLIALLLGVAISFVSLAKLVTYLMENHIITLWSFFFGLVAASILYVGKQVGKWNVNTIVSLIVGAIVAYSVTILPPLGGSESSIFIFFSGFIAICAMILPGISGSFILLILGAYKPVMAAFSDFNVTILGMFGAGCVIGLLSFARVLKFLFTKYKDITIAVLTGFLIGSLNKIWPWKHVSEIFVKHQGEADEEVISLVETNVMPGSYDTFTHNSSTITGYVEGDANLGMAILFFVIGFAIIFGMEFAAKKMKKSN
ncbi:MAG: putative membrane protein [Parvicella sp.]|jgi:putative membrane protein